jgi:hypothetical protein
VADLPVDIAQAAVSIVGSGSVAGMVSLLAWRIAAARTEGRSEAEQAAHAQNIQALREEIAEARKEFRAGLAELHTVASLTAQLKSSQDVVNVMNAKAFESIVSRLDKHDDAIIEQGQLMVRLEALVLSWARKERADG